MSLQRLRNAGGCSVMLGLLACQAEVTCPEDGTPCGGDPAGTWNVLTNACRDPVFAPPLQVSSLGQPVQMARQPVPVASSSDWCSSLVLGTQGISGFSFPHDTLAVTGAQIAYTTDAAQPDQGSYQAVIKTDGTGEIDLSRTCLTRTSMPLTCDLLQAALTDFAAIKLQDPGIPCTDAPNQPLACQFYYSYQGITCTGIADGGCHCSYAVSFQGTVGGRWRRSGTVLTHSDASRMLPSQADYCVNGGSLSLWGHDRTSILNQNGIRTLQFARTP